MIFDSHAHYDDEAFCEDREALLGAMKTNGIGYIVNVGASLKTTKSSLELAKQYDFIYAAVGVHPSETGELREENVEELVQFSRQEKAVAIGEIGLDYYYPEPEKELQKYWFKSSWILRYRKSFRLLFIAGKRKDTFEILKQYDGKLKGGIIHCYSYSTEMHLSM